MELGNKIAVKIAVGILAVCTLSFGCTTREELDSRAAIRLGVSGSTRTVVDDLEGLRAVGGNIGVYGVKTPGHTSASGADWSYALFVEDVADGGTLIMNNVRTTSIAADGAIHWNGRYFYPLDENAGVKFCAYYPYESAGSSVTDPAEGQAPVLNFQLDGTQDVMYALPVMGWRNKTTPSNLVFRHVLTQLTFVLMDPEQVFVGKPVNGITVRGVNTTGKMNVETGEIADWGGSASLSVGGFDAPVEITGDAVTAGQRMGDEIMLQPGQKSFTVAVDIDGKIYDNIVVRPSSPATVFERGKSYRISLTFVDRVPIFMGATVEPWEFAGSGFVEVI